MNGAIMQIFHSKFESQMGNSLFRQHYITGDSEDRVSRRDLED